MSSRRVKKNNLIFFQKTLDFCFRTSYIINVIKIKINKPLPKMPYLDKNYTKEVRQELKRQFPEFKFSVRTVDHHKLDVTVLSGPMDLMSDVDRVLGYEQVNHFWVDKHYQDNPQKRDFLMSVLSIMGKEHNSCEFVDGDYGDIPNFYLGLSIGRWGRPYVQK